MLVQGHFPEYDNEIVISTMVSKRLGAKIGDVIYIQGKREKVSYIVTGIDQKINKMGLIVLMTLEGGKKLDDTIEPAQIYIYANEDYNSISKQIAEKYPDLKLRDNAKLAESSVSAVVLGTQSLCIIFAVMTAIAIILVVFLLVKARIIRERKNYGVNRALGFTTKQLIFQIIMSILPIIFTGALAG